MYVCGLHVHGFRLFLPAHSLSCKYYAKSNNLHLSASSKIVHDQVAVISRITLGFRMLNVLKKKKKALTLKLTWIGDQIGKRCSKSVRTGIMHCRRIV